MYIELPKGDPKLGTGLLGKLKLCLYGTRDAAKGWQETLSAHLTNEARVDTLKQATWLTNLDEILAQTAEGSSVVGTSEKHVRLTSTLLRPPSNGKY